ncbi:MAG: PGPGW domain-containing protein [Verrucomicrobiota bacterium]
MILLRKCLVAILGGALLIAGLAMLVLPGPAIVVIPAALAILAVEFLWARRWLNWLRERYRTLLPNRPASVCKLNRLVLPSDATTLSALNRNYE